MSKVSEIMTKSDIQFVNPSTSVRVAAEDMRRLHRGCLVVIYKGKLVGIVTERDLVQKVLATGKDPMNTPVSKIMSRPVISVSPEMGLSNAAKLMVANKIRRLPVVEGSKVVGMLTVSDFAKYMRLRDRDEPLWAAASRAADYQTIFE